MEAVDRAWDAIIPAHGIVALDHQWAASHNLIPARSLPGDDSKGVYILDSYHQIHCLVASKLLISSFSPTNDSSSLH